MYGKPSEPARKMAVCLTNRLRNITSAAAEVSPQTGHWSTVRCAPQSRQRVMQGSIPSGGRMRARKVGDELVVKFAVLFLKGDRDTHTLPRLDALDETVDRNGALELKVRSETGAHPEGIEGLDEHAAGADVAGASTQRSGTPLDVYVGAKAVTWSPATFQTARIVR